MAGIDDLRSVVDPDDYQGHPEVSEHIQRAADLLDGHVASLRVPANDGDIDRSAISLEPAPLAVDLEEKAEAIVASTTRISALTTGSSSALWGDLLARVGKVLSGSVDLAPLQARVDSLTARRDALKNQHDALVGSIKELEEGIDAEAKARVDALFAALVADLSLNELSSTALIAGLRAQFIDAVAALDGVEALQPNSLPRFPWNFTRIDNGYGNSWYVDCRVDDMTFKSGDIVAVRNKDVANPSNWYFVEGYGMSGSSRRLLVTPLKRKKKDESKVKFNGPPQRIDQDIDPLVIVKKWGEYSLEELGLALDKPTKYREIISSGAPEEDENGFPYKKIVYTLRHGRRNELYRIVSTLPNLDLRAGDIFRNKRNGGLRMFLGHEVDENGVAVGTMQFAIVKEDNIFRPQASVYRVRDITEYERVESWGQFDPEKYDFDPRDEWRFTELLDANY